MGSCIVNVFKQYQQDATLHNGIYYILFIVHHVMILGK